MNQSHNDRGRQAAEIEVMAERARERGLEDASKALAKLVDGLAMQLAQGHTRPKVALQTLMLRAIAHGRRIEREIGENRGKGRPEGAAAGHLRAVT
jgi:hypothetical protein